MRRRAWVHTQGRGVDQHAGPQPLTHAYYMVGCSRSHMARLILGDERGEDGREEALEVEEAARESRRGHLHAPLVGRVDLEVVPATIGGRGCNHRQQQILQPQLAASVRS